MKHLLHKHRGTKVLGHSFMAENTHNFSPLFPPSACCCFYNPIIFTGITFKAYRFNTASNNSVRLSSITSLWMREVQLNVWNKTWDLEIRVFTQFFFLHQQSLFVPFIRDNRLWCNVSRCVRLPRAERKQTSVKLCRVDCVIEKLCSVWMWK